jgi:hypothetical protein
MTVFERLEQEAREAAGHSAEVEGFPETARELLTTTGPTWTDQGQPINAALAVIRKEGERWEERQVADGPASLVYEKDGATLWLKGGTILILRKSAPATVTLEREDVEALLDCVETVADAWNDGGANALACKLRAKLKEGHDDSL